MGNICRSPAAEIIFRSTTTEAGRHEEFVIDSAGTIGFHQGNPPDARMAATLRRRGYDVQTSGARQIQRKDLDTFDLIVTMDASNTEDVLELATGPEQRAKVRPFTEFCAHLDVSEVPDPYYGGADGFDHVVDILEDGCPAILGQFPK